MAPSPIPASGPTWAGWEYAVPSRWPWAASPRPRRCWPPSNWARARTPTAAANTPSDPLRKSSAGDVAVQVLEFDLLVLDHRLDQVADRHQAQHRPARI